MDTETRGLIEGNINHIFEEQGILETINWIFEVDDKIKSREDLALGYFLGSLMNRAIRFINTKKIYEKYEERLGRIRKKSDKNLEMLLGKEKAREIIAERYELEKKGKKVRPIQVTITEEDIEEVRNILVRWIIPFREKILIESYK